MKIVVGIPAFNEEENIGKIIAKLKKITNEIIICNDNSTDSTKEIAEQMGVIVVNHERNLGYGAAIKTIFLKAREVGADILVTMDGDGQHRIEDLKTITKPILEKQSDIVIGSRFLENEEKNIPKYRKIGIKAITKLANISLENPITDSQSGFRSYSKKAIEEITPSENGMGISNEILIKASKLRMKILEVPIEVLYDGDTSTHNPVSQGVSVILSTLKFISIDHPLKFYGIPGIIFLIVGIIFMIATLQIFSETRQILLSTAIISVGTIVVGTMLVMSSIILYSIVNILKEQSSK
jgi:glycosyltransferase involved in cell wall biosynthesis